MNLPFTLGLSDSGTDRNSISESPMWAEGVEGQQDINSIFFPNEGGYQKLQSGVFRQLKFWEDPMSDILAWTY